MCFLFFFRVFPVTIFTIHPTPHVVAGPETTGADVEGGGTTGHVGHAMEMMEMMEMPMLRLSELNQRDHRTIGCRKSQGIRDILLNSCDICDI